MILRTAKLVFITALLSVGLGSLSYAGQEAIDEVELTFSWDRKPAGGELVGHISASSSDSQFVIEGCEYAKKDDTWTFGERPVAEIDLSAKEDCYFSRLTKEDFKLSGCGVQYQSVEVENDGSSLTLQVYLPGINGTLPKTTAASWTNDNTASWDEVGGSRCYRVKLLKNGLTEKTVYTRDTSYNFSSDMENNGNYTFSVQALGYCYSQTGHWVDSDDTIKI